MASEFGLIDLFLSRGDKDTCAVLNEYFGQEGIPEFFDSDDEKCREFIESVSRINKGLHWFLARISLAKQQKVSNKQQHVSLKRERDDSDSDENVDDQDYQDHQMDESADVIESVDNSCEKH